MKLNELAKTETPVDVTPEQLARAEALAKAVEAAKLPVEPTLAEGTDAEFIEM